jgi:hypothetical protein
LIFAALRRCRVSGFVLANPDRKERVSGFVLANPDRKKQRN